MIEVGTSTQDLHPLWAKLTYPFSEEALTIPISCDLGWSKSPRTIASSSAAPLSAILPLVRVAPVAPLAGAILLFTRNLYHKIGNPNRRTDAQTPPRPAAQHGSLDGAETDADLDARTQP